jgi:hypothetical protein
MDFKQDSQASQTGYMPPWVNIPQAAHKSNFIGSGSPVHGTVPVHVQSCWLKK